MKELFQKVFFYIRSLDWVLVVSLLAIMAMGVLNLMSASNATHRPFYLRQLLWYCIGICLMLGLHKVDYRVIARYAEVIYLGVCGLLVLVLFFGRTIGGSQRWLHFAFFNIQPSEFAKLAMVICFARYFYEKDKKVYGFKDLIKPVILAAIPCILILKQPDLGTAILIVLLLASMAIVARIRWTTLVGIVVTAMAFLPLAWQYLRPYQKKRIITLFNPESDPFGAGYHIIQSKVAIGSGGLWGKGFMHGTQAHLSFLPEVHTDFAFSLWGEEWGFFGAILLLFFFGVVIYRGLHVAFTANERLGSFLAFGITAMFFWEAVVNINMVMGLLPVVGVPLPLFSYGGSSAMVTLMGMGIIMGVRSRRYLFSRH